MKMSYRLQLPLQNALVLLHIRCICVKFTKNDYVEKKHRCHQQQTNKNKTVPIESRNTKTSTEENRLPWC